MVEKNLKKVVNKSREPQLIILDRSGNAITRKSPIEQNPLVDVGARGQLLQLAINTDQTGRVFQDRSHVFFIEPRPTRK